MLSGVFTPMGGEGLLGWKVLLERGAAAEIGSRFIFLGKRPTLSSAQACAIGDLPGEPRSLVTYGGP